MQFEKAYEELLKGKKIRRREWEHFMHLRLIDKEVKTFKGEYTDFYQDSNILISNGWLVLGEEDKEMNFIDAFQELKLKKKIINKDWIEEGLNKFLFIDNNKFVLGKSIEYDFMPNYHCLTASDWEVMK